MTIRVHHTLLVIFSAGLLLTAARQAWDSPYLGATALVFYLLVPGALLLVNIVDPRNLEIGSALVLSVAYSVAFLMFGAFALNAALPFVGVTHPLAVGPISLGLNTVLVLLIGVTYWRRGSEVLDVSAFRRRFRSPDVVLVALFALLPVQAVAGALLLNKGASGVSALATSVEAVALVAVVFALGPRLNRAVLYPVALVSVSCAVLLMVSMRSGYVFGWDINQELHVLDLAQQDARWMYSAFRDPYNTCLSITTFPVALSALTGIDAVWLLKLVYPVLLGFSSLALYKLFEKYGARTWAYLAVLVVIAQPPYMTEMPMLARQEIAFLFVASAYLVLLTHRKPNTVGDTVLFLLLTMSLIVSHYATTYVFILSLCVMYAWQKLVAYQGKKTFSIPRRMEWTRSLLSLRVLIACVGLTLLWGVQFGSTSTSVWYFASNVYTNMGRSLAADLKSQSLESAVFNLYKPDAKQMLREYVKQTTKDTGTETESRYLPTVKSPRTARGALPGTVGFFSYVYPIVSTFLKVCLVLGLLLFLRLRRHDERSVLFQGAVVSYGIGLVAFFLLPYVSLAYNFERFVLQALFVLALPTLLGLAYFARGVRRLATHAASVALVVVLVYWVFTLGLAAEVLGGSAPVHYNNFGLQYSRFYLQAPEAAAMRWLGRTAAGEAPIHADMYAATRLLPYAGIPASQVDVQMVPPFLPGGYVFASRTNVVEGMTFARVNNREISFTYPTAYLEENRNTVYSNGSATVYQ